MPITKIINSKTQEVRTGNCKKCGELMRSLVTHNSQGEEIVPRLCAPCKFDNDAEKLESRAKVLRGKANQMRFERKKSL